MPGNSHKESAGFYLGVSVVGFIFFILNLFGYFKYGSSSVLYLSIGCLAFGVLFGIFAWRHATEHKREVIQCMRAELRIQEEAESRQSALDVDLTWIDCQELMRYSTFTKILASGVTSETFSTFCANNKQIGYSRVNQLVEKIAEKRLKNR